MELHQIKRQAKALGATLDISEIGRWVTINADAPIGKVWAATGDTHCLVAEWLHFDIIGKEFALRDLADRMSDGLTDCDNPDCDNCCPEG